MSIKQDFIEYVERCSKIEPMSDEVKEFWTKFKDSSSSGENKKQFTDNGKKILLFMQEHPEVQLWKSKDIAEGMFISARTVSGAIRKLANDGFVEKMGQDPVIYSITEKGKAITIN